MNDFIVNGQGYGNVAGRLLKSGMDSGSLRPYLWQDGRSYVTLMQNGQPKILTTNAEATLRYEEWRLIDEAVISAGRSNIRAVGDLQAAGLEVKVPGMGVIMYSYQVMSDITPAEASMSPLVRSERDRLTFNIRDLPLYIIHKQFSYDIRELEAGRRNGTPIDTLHAAAATRQVMQLAESYLIGNSTPFAYGGASAYGYRTFPQRMTKVLTLPTAGGWNGGVLLNEVTAMKQQSINAFHSGPWVLYVSPGWEPYLDDDYSAAYPNVSTRDRIGRISGISAIRTLDELSDYQMILVEMSAETVRLVNGLPLRTVQWDGPGGFEVHFKVMMILVPQFRSDINSNTGIVHGTAA